MSLADSLRRAAQVGRAAAARVAQRPTIVTVVVEQWSKPVGAAGATLLSSTETVLTPTPKVTLVGGDNSPFGGGQYTGPDASLDAALLRIGPITHKHAGGGYDPETTVPKIADPTQVTYVRLSGEAFADGSERFRIANVDGTRPQSWSFIVQRSAQD